LSNRIIWLTCRNLCFTPLTLYYTASFHSGRQTVVLDGSFIDTGWAWFRRRFLVSASNCAAWIRHLLIWVSFLYNWRLVNRLHRLIRIAGFGHRCLRPFFLFRQIFFPIISSKTRAWLGLVEQRYAFRELVAAYLRRTRLVWS